MGGIGFRDLHPFNLAMLAKQGWKLLHNPESIVARILKARYFPLGNFITAHVEANPSFTWRSIMEGLDLLLKGIIWRVGTCSFIDVQMDPWLPTHEGFKMMDPHLIPTSIQIMSQLIIQDPSRWKLDLITTHLLEGEAKAIIELPLTQTYQEGTFFWQPKPRGLFLVKSAY